MLAVVSLLCVLTLSLFVTRVATVALAHTGLSREAARFQARSAFTGVGFTTNESEKVVNHPVRRRILMGLMLVGNAGIVTAVSSLILTFLSFDEPSSDGLAHAAALFIGLLALLGLASNAWLDRRLSIAIGWMLKRFTDLDVKDYDSLLQLSGEYRVSELYVEADDWLAGRRLGELELRREGLNVLGVKRASGAYEGNPVGDTRLAPADAIIVYGRTSDLAELDTRRAGWRGDAEHRRAVRERRRRSEPGVRPGGVATAS